MLLLISNDESAGEKCSSIPCPGPEGFGGRSDRVAQGAVVGLAGGAHVDCLWGRAQADVGVLYGSPVPCQCSGCGCMEGN